MARTILAALTLTLAIAPVSALPPSNAKTLEHATGVLDDLAAIPLKGIPPADRKQRITDGLERVGLTDWRKKSVESLSKGMQQKLQFVATTLHDPELVILDEPFSGLDPLNRDLLEALMIDLKQRGRTVIFSTHQMEQAERLCDRIVLINRGRMLIEGTLPEVRGRFAGRMVTLAGVGAAWCSPPA